MTIVSTMASNKNDRVYVRVNEEIKGDFEVVASYRGLNTSALLHSLMVKTIHEQRELTPHIFIENTVAGKSSDKRPDETAKIPTSPENLSVSARNKSKSNKTKKIFLDGDGEMPLVDEAESANEDDVEK